MENVSEKKNVIVTYLTFQITLIFHGQFCVSKYIPLHQLYFIDCTTITVGSSGAQTKTVTTYGEYTCPIVVNKNNWLGGYVYPDTFSVQQRETDIVVTRTDSTSGWGMNLEFQCCGSGKVSYISYIKNSNAFVF